MLETDEEGKREVAVRELQKDARKTEAIRFMQEVAILTQLHHPSIVQFYGIVENENLVSKHHQKLVVCLFIFTL